MACCKPCDVVVIVVVKASSTIPCNIGQLMRIISWFADLFLVFLVPMILLADCRSFSSCV